MTEELARVVCGLPVAALWPLAVPALAISRWKVALASVTSALYVLAPQLPGVKAFVLLALTSIMSLFAANRTAKAPAEGRTPLPSAQVVAAVVVASGAAAVIDIERAADVIRSVVENDAISLAISGFATSVFIGGSFVGWILSPFTAALKDEDIARASLAHAGRYIGWFERAILFAFVIGGEPQAAAVALAAKSFARFPSLREHQEGFAEYFLIGSLASITVAIAAAIATRAALGLGPF
ncbi:MAG: hypothetical protein ACTHKT_00245 [Solirubrobacterales bacterium]